MMILLTRALYQTAFSTSSSRHTRKKAYNAATVIHSLIRLLCGTALDTISNKHRKKKADDAAARLVLLMKLPY